jgi:FlaA1/EpsC-like NDP-sugar epimerase
MKNLRRLMVFSGDVVLIATAFTLSFLFRFDFNLPVGMRSLFWQGLCVVILIKPLVFCCAGFYRNLWQYASLQDAVKIFKVVSISSVIAAFVIEFFRHFAPFPRSIIAMDCILLLFLVSISRLGWRVYRGCPLAAKGVKRHRALIVGAGEAGSLLLKEIKRQSGSDYDVVGFVDDDDAKQGMLLNGFPVLGKLAQLQSLVEKFGIEEIIIAIPSARGKVLRNIVESCKKMGVRFTTLPTIGDIIDGKISVSQIKDVEIGDLLGREAVVINEDSLRNYLTDKKVLVSGAAGSIGSEICRQVARLKPDKLILLDNAETPLFYIERELAAKYPDIKLIPLIRDIRNKEKIEILFDEFMPDVVFHAAAYKHVPMMEYNSTEAVSNNIGGTRIMADAAHRFGVKDFVMISTDKAVNPTNVMGASKRVAEIYIQALSGNSATNFTTVRFGNVLGSNGSVIPLFMEQIKNGGPVTVTDPNIVRYFMTIPEATLLVLQAGYLGKGGEIFVLDMGEPVRIKDLAEELIKLSGLTPYEDIDIVFTGLRPGEKLYEELLMEGEGIMPTAHEKIRVAAAVETDLRFIRTEVDLLLRLADEADIMGIMHSLRRLVLEFIPSYRFNSQAVLSQQRALNELYSKRTPAATTAKILPLRAKSADQNLSAKGF